MFINITSSANVDCNENCIDDALDLSSGTSLDCNQNGQLDDCETTGDCDGNGVPDSCEPAGDCDGNGTLDACEPFADCNANGVSDACDLQNGRADCNGNGLIDLCELNSGATDCDGNGIPDECDTFSGADCNGNGVPDECDVLVANSDCNGNSVPDECDLEAGTLTDADLNGMPDQCDPSLAGTPFCFGVPSLGGCDGCPCGNSLPQSLGGCTNAAGRSAVLIAFGTPSASSDSLNFYLQGAASNNLAILVSAENPLPSSGTCLGTGFAGTVFDGKRCVGGSLRRHGGRVTDVTGTVLVAWGPDGAPSGGLIAAGAFSTGQVRRFQSIYRDNMGGACGTSQNTSNAVEVMMVP